MSQARSPADGVAAPVVDAIVVGAGFAGLYMVNRLCGLGMSVQGFEGGSDVGGTWYWNRYPGCRCDVESLEYSYSFDRDLEQEWEWTERYAPQPEILAYARHVADRFDLRRHFRFDTRVKSARWIEDEGLWEVQASGGLVQRARFCIMATGCLSAGRTPHFEGLDLFRGRVLHTSTWPFEGVDFGGQRVAVMGVGSSGVQAIPLIAQHAAQLHVLLRTPNYVVPARNSPLPPEQVQDWKARYPEIRRRALGFKGGLLLDVGPSSASELDAQAREAALEERWRIGGAFSFQSTFNDLQTNVESNRLASDFLRAKIAGIVRNPAWAQWLQPEHLVGTRRLCVGTDYYEAYNRDNVELVNLRQEPLARFTPTGVIVGDREIGLDAMVFATGFDAMTGALSAIEVTGRGGRTLAQHWHEGARAHLGLMPAGFPNLFAITGPGSPSVLSNVLVSIEQHVNWIADCLACLQAAGKQQITAEDDAEQSWMAHVRDLGQATLFADGNSWYLGSNVPGKPRVFLPYSGGVPAYREHCARVAASGYPGFDIR